MASSFDNGFSNGFGWNNNQSELVIAKNNSHYDDGDVIFAVTKRELNMVGFAKALASQPKEIINGVISSGVHQDFAEATAQYKFVRVDATGVMRQNLSTNDVDYYSAPTIDIPAAIKTKRKKQSLFTSNGNLCWYTGTRDYVDRDVWSVLSQYGIHESGYMKYPYSSTEISQNIIITSNSLSPTTKATLTSPVIEPSGNITALRSKKANTKITNLSEGDYRGVKYITNSIITDK